MQKPQQTKPSTSQNDFSKGMTLFQYLQKMHETTDSDSKNQRQSDSDQQNLYENLSQDNQIQEKAIPHIETRKISQIKNIPFSIKELDEDNYQESITESRIKDQRDTQKNQIETIQSHRFSVTRVTPNLFHESNFQFKDKPKREHFKTNSLQKRNSLITSNQMATTVHGKSWSLKKQQQNFGMNTLGIFPKIHIKKKQISTPRKPQNHIYEKTKKQLSSLLKYQQQMTKKLLSRANIPNVPQKKGWRDMKIEGFTNTLYERKLVGI